MSDPNVFNVLKSGAVLWWAEVGEPFPDPALVGDSRGNPVYH